MPNMYRFSLAILLLLFSLTGLQAQGEQFPPDTLCLTAGGPGFNVVLDDFPAGLEYFVEAQPTECYRIDEAGNVFVPEDIDQERCCGPQPRFFVSVFTFDSSGAAQFLYRQEVLLEIKCPKPDCGLVDLEEIPQPDPVQNPDVPQDIPCINACENSTATYLFSENPALTYLWSTSNVGASIDPLPGLPGQISVTWGPLGPGSLSVDIFDGSGNLLTTRSWCVTLTEAPVADFTATSVACLDQDVYFTNTSTGAAATYDWDFGDGNTAQNVATPTVAHAYSSPGTYSVTLVATSNGGLNADGSQACCCVDSVSYDITIDPDPGPGIFWISTLCEGDTSKYWTDATNCLATSWSISPNGTPMGPLTNVDTIMVIWNSGPSGTIELSVNGCDSTYCPAPSVAVVPIISTNGVISGPIEVCGGETANYSLPKWMTTTYTWALPDGGVLNGSTDGHQASITWPTTPGTYQIVVEYGSEFLAGLPGHDGNDCYGRAVLDVTVLGNFSLSAAPSPACVDGNTFFNAFSDLGPATFDWSVNGFPALDASGQPNYNVNWSSLPGPGVYTITASVTNPGDYCVAVKSISVVVKEAIDPVIIGPNDYCVGEPVVYSILSPTPGYTYTWSVAGGSVSLGQFGPTATIVFTGPTGVVSVTGQDSQAPNCVSASISLTAEEIGFNEPAAIEGPAACTNSLAVYSLDSLQHPTATYAWSVMPEIAGSVVMGADLPSATIQWNDTPGPVTIKVEVTICDETRTYSLPLTLNAPIDPVIIQVGDLCIGGSATLLIDSTQFDSIVWDLGGNAGAVWGPNAGSITVFEEGNYVVNTFDVNGCPGVDRFRVEAVDGPEITISAVGARQICVNSPPYPANPVLTANTAPGNTIEWFCGVDSQGPAAIGNTTFTHVWTDSVASFVYFARAVDPVTGCTEDSDPLIIRQILCCDTPYVADPISQLHTFEATRQSPNCDLVDLVATWSPDSVVGHGFSWDYLGVDIISFGGDEIAGNDSMTIRLPGVGCYDIFHNIDVWAFEYDTTFTIDANGNQLIDQITKVDSIRCGTSLRQTVCNPLFADFDKREECGVVEFTDESDFDLPTPAPTITYTWDFGDGSPQSNAINPTHEYGSNGTYTVTLTITDGDCVSTATMTVEVEDLPDTDFTVAPNPVCYGQPATFTGTGTNVIEWEWDFADGATFNGNGPQHTFLPPLGSGDYDVTLVTTNRAGCRDTVVKTIDVFPTPLLDTIEASNGFIICDGDATVLSVDNVAGLTYLWSTGATGPSITVTTAGIYGVTLTNVDNCQQVIAPVEVQVIPLPDASWIGNTFICDNGSTKLTALAGGGHSFSWVNQTTGQLASGMMYNVPFNPSFPVQTIELTVTNLAYGCTAVSAITVEQVLSPNPDVQITAGGNCEGDGTLLEVVNPEPDVVYSWNTGATGTSIFTYAAGTYTVIATNVITGCTGTDQEVVHPLPDICIVPTGCYETCAPDTLIAPSGDYTYAWYQNGLLVGTGDSLIVDESASYSVTVMDNATGCASTSDSLYLIVIDCDNPPGDDCDDIVTRLAPTTIDSDIGSCCFDLYYTGLPDGIHTIQISSNDADLTYLPGSNNPPLGHVTYSGPSEIQLSVDATASVPVPNSMTGPPALTFCPNDPTDFPQEIIVEYLNIAGEVVCTDTLYTECAVEPDCVYVTTDSIFCDDKGDLVFTFTICNPADADFAVGYLDLLPASPTAATVLPLGFTLSPALAPGDCRTITTSLPALPPGAVFAYTLIGHSADPDIDPSALCCSDPSVNRELLIPDCDPCDNVGIRRVSPRGSDDCCYDVVLFNNAPAPYTFDGIDLCLIGSDGALTVYSAIGDPLTGVVNAGGQSVSVFDPTGNVLPNGNIRLPRICIEDAEQPLHQIEVKWISNGGVVCRDTFEVFCTPPCGYLKEESIKCDEGFYVWSGEIVNTSSFTMGEAHIEFADSLGLAAYDTTIVFGTPLAPGQSQPIMLLIGSPAGPGDKITFTVTFHELGPDDYHLNCCQFEVCIQLPDCQIEKCDCENPEQFQQDVNLAFDSIGLPLVDPLAYRFDPRADFTSCDSIVWSVRRRSPNGPWQQLGSNQVQDYTFPTPGRYQIWMRVYRFADNGELCFVRNAFITYNIGSSFTGGGIQGPDVGEFTYEVVVFPNPVEDGLQVIVPANINRSSKLMISVHDVQGRRTHDFSWDNLAPGGQRKVTLNVGDLPAGVYLLRGTDGVSADWTRRFVKQ